MWVGAEGGSENVGVLGDDEGTWVVGVYERAVESMSARLRDSETRREASAVRRKGRVCVVVWMMRGRECCKVKPGLLLCN